MNHSFRYAFRSLAIYNYRLWFAGALVSNIGTWMQRIAQDWLVLTQLTPHNATAVGVVMALQFGPQVLLLPLTGLAADTFDRRRLLMTTQGIMGSLALGLGMLTVTDAVQLWHVYVFAGLLGCATAFDVPVRQAFVAEMVGEADLINAVALNSISFNAARMIGPAVAGVLIAIIGTGWVFLLNAASFAAVLAALVFLRQAELYGERRRGPRTGGVAEGFRYIRSRPDLQTMLLMAFLIGTFGQNFPIFISVMSVRTFHVGADQYGLLTSAMAVGSILGALMAARAERPSLGTLLVASACFGAGCVCCALMPDYGLFAVMLLLVGVAAQIFTTSINSLVQITTKANLRGRVLAILFALSMGGTPLGAPLVGRIADVFGPRWALGVGAAAGLAAALVGVLHLLRSRRHEAASPGSAPHD